MSTDMAITRAGKIADCSEGGSEGVLDLQIDPQEGRLEGRLAKDLTDLLITDFLDVKPIEDSVKLRAIDKKVPKEEKDFVRIKKIAKIVQIICIPLLIGGIVAAPSTAAAVIVVIGILFWGAREF